MNLRSCITGLLVGLILSPAGAAVSTRITNTLDDGAWIFTSPLHLTSNDIPPALLITTALGGSLVLDRITRNNLRPYADTEASNDLRHYGDVGQFLGPIAGGALAVSGWTQHDDYQKKVAWDLFESFLWANAVSETFRIALGRLRPSATDDPFELRPVKLSSSFPSGHTISAFAAATTLSDYYPTWKVALPAYMAATAVGFSRIYSNNHWGSDVVGGALMGYGVSHTLFKRHQRHTKTSWNIQMSPGGVELTRRF